MLTVGQLAQHIHTLDPNLPIGIMNRSGAGLVVVAAIVLFGS